MLPRKCAIITPDEPLSDSPAELQTELPWLLAQRHARRRIDRLAPFLQNPVPFRLQAARRQQVAIGAHCAYYQIHHFAGFREPATMIQYVEHCRTQRHSGLPEIIDRRLPSAQVIVRISECAETGVQVLPPRRE